MDNSSEFTSQLYQRVATEFPDIADLKKSSDGDPFKTKITVRPDKGKEFVEAGRSVKKEILDLLIPKFSDVHLVSLIADTEGSTAFCVLPNPQRQDRLAMGLAPTLEPGIQLTIRQILKEPYSRESKRILERLDPAQHDEMLKAVLSVTLETSFTRLGLGPLPFLDLITAKYQDIAKLTAEKLAEDLKRKSDLCTQVSKLPKHDHIRNFNSALSAHAPTMARSIGMMGNTMTWRLNMGNPEFFETLNLDRVPISFMNDTAREYVKTLYPSDTAGWGMWTDEYASIMGHATEMWLIAKGTTNAERLNSMLTVMNGLSAKDLVNLYPSSYYNEQNIREKLTEGFRLLMVSSARTKQHAFNQTVEDLAHGIRSLAHRATEDELADTIIEPESVNDFKLRPEPAEEVPPPPPPEA
jgi:hypothetical protein